MVSMVLILFHIHNTNLNELVRKKLSDYLKEKRNNLQFFKKLNI